MEILYKWLQEENYEGLIDFIKQKKNQTLIKQDLGIANAISMFFKDILTWKIDKSIPNPRFKDLFEDLFALHRAQLYILPKLEFQTVVVELVKLNMDNPPAAYNYATHFPSHTVCTQVIQEYDENKLKHIEHAQDHRIHSSENIPVTENITKSLFYSYQEKLFFFALRNVYDSYQILPNVALKAIINLEVIKDQLTAREVAFFNTSLIDFVVIDQFDNYRPKVAFELDSVFHHFDEQKHLDLIKNKILNLCGLKLFRIEHTQKEKEVNDFEKTFDRDSWTLDGVLKA